MSFSIDGSAKNTFAADLSWMLTKRENAWFAHAARKAEAAAPEKPDGHSFSSEFERAQKAAGPK